MKFLIPLALAMAFAPALHAGVLFCRDKRLGFEVELQDQGKIKKRQGNNAKFLVGTLVRNALGDARILTNLMCSPVGELENHFSCVNADQNEADFLAQIFWSELDDSLVAKLTRQGELYSYMTCRWTKKKNKPTESDEF